MPNAVVGKNRFDVAHKRHGILQIIKHGDRRDDLRAVVRKLRPEKLSRKEVGQQRDVVGIIQGELPPGRVNTDLAVTAGIGFQRGGIVATDIDDQVGG